MCNVIEKKKKLPTDIINYICIGAWASNVAAMAGLSIPLIPMKHSCIISEPIEGISNLPNLRDHDSSIYFRIQNESLCLGGYENNPAILDKVIGTITSVIKIKCFYEKYEKLCLKSAI